MLECKTLLWNLPLCAEHLDPEHIDAKHLDAEHLYAEHLDAEHLGAEHLHSYIGRRKYPACENHFSVCVFLSYMTILFRAPPPYFYLNLISFN